MALSRDVARKAVTVLRDRRGLLPLRRDQRVMVIEQLIIPEFVPNNMHYHAHSFNEAMLEHSLNLVNVDCEFHATEQERATILGLLDKVDAIVMTNWFWRIFPQNNPDLIEAIVKRRKPLVVVTNNPYPMGAAPQAGTVVCTYSVTPQSLKAAAGVVYGKLEVARPVAARQLPYARLARSVHGRRRLGHRGEHQPARQRQHRATAETSRRTSAPRGRGARP